MSKRHFGIPTLFEPVDTRVPPRGGFWRQDFWEFVLVAVIAIAAMFAGIVGQ